MVMGTGGGWRGGRGSPGVSRTPSACLRFLQRYGAAPIGGRRAWVEAEERRGDFRIGEDTVRPSVDRFKFVGRLNGVYPVRHLSPAVRWEPSPTQSDESIETALRRA